MIPISSVDDTSIKKDHNLKNDQSGTVDLEWMTNSSLPSANYIHPSIPRQPVQVPSWPSPSDTTGHRPVGTYDLQDRQTGYLKSSPDLGLGGMPHLDLTGNKNLITGDPYQRRTADSVLKSPFAPSLRDGSQQPSQFTEAALDASSLTGTFGAPIRSFLVGQMFSSGEATAVAASEVSAEFKKQVPKIVEQLRVYFSVSQEYVFHKILKYLLPLIFTVIQKRRRRSRSYRKQTSNSGFTVEESHKEHRNDRPKQFLDLYIPVMAFITYILLVAVTRGTLDEFHPSVLYSTASFSVVVIILESFTCKLSLYLCSTGQTFFDDLINIVALSGYKFLSIVLTIVFGLTQISSDIPYWIAFAYFSLCASTNTFKFLRKIGQSVTNFEWGLRQTSYRPIHFVIFVWALLQIPLCWFLIPSWEYRKKS